MRNILLMQKCFYLTFGEQKFLLKLDYYLAWSTPKSVSTINQHFSSQPSLFNIWWSFEQAGAELGQAQLPTGIWLYYD